MKRAICLILSFVLVISCFPVRPAAAQEQTTTQVLPEELISLEQDPTTEPGETIPSEPEDTTPAETLPEETTPEETTPEESAPADRLPVKAATRATSSDGFSYTVVDGGAVITGVPDGENAVIPETVDGYPVTGVDFSNLWGIINVTLPDSITTIGYRAFEDCTGLTTIVLPSTLTSIDEYAFTGCTALTSIVLPSSLTSIGEGAFWKCSSLTTLSVPDNIQWIGNAALRDCGAFIYNQYDNAYYLGNANNPYVVLMKAVSTDISSVQIHPNTKVINEYAFSGCAGLTEVVIPDSVTCIGSNAFAGCSSLQSLTIPFVGAGSSPEADAYLYPLGYLFGTQSFTGATVVQQSYAIKNGGNTSSKFYIPDALRSVVVTGGEITKGAFYNCKNLTQIVLSDGVTGVGNVAFFSCTGLTSMRLPAGVTFVGDEAFKGCSALTEIQLPEGITSIDYGAFWGCSGLTNLRLPDSLTSIGEYAFYNCTGLTDINVPDGVTHIGNNAFTNCGSIAYTIYDNAKYLGDAENPYRVLAMAVSTDITSCRIHPDNKQINPSAFANCKNLTQLELAAGTTRIGSGAFSGCNALTSITIPDGVTEIEERTFTGCSGLTSIQLPQGITQIGSSAFNGCTSLAAIQIPDGVTAIGASAFADCTALTGIVLPDSVTELGTDAFWRCTKLENVTLSKGLTKLGNSFRYCSSLKTLVIPANVTTIEAGALAGIPQLESLTVPYVGYQEHSGGVIYYHPFGYFFGEASYTGAVAVTQDVYNRYYNADRTYTYYIPETLKSVTVLRGELIPGVFKNLTGMNELVLGEGVTDIHYQALDNCTGLTNLVVSNSLAYVDSETLVLNDNIQYNQYENGLYLGNSTEPYLVLVDTVSESITSLEIHPQSIMILHNALQNCSSLTQLVVPDSVVHIGKDAFLGCKNLQSLTVPMAYSVSKYWSSPSSYPFGYFFGAVYDDYGALLYYDIPSSLKQITVTGGEIVYNAFKDCSDVTSIILGDRVTGMGDSAFESCYSLTKVVIGNGVTRIGARAFWYCTKLSDLTIGNGVMEIGEDAFGYCDKLTSLTIPDTVKTIEARALANCGGLQSLTIPFLGISLETPRRLGFIFGHYSNKDQHNTYAVPGTYYVPSSLYKVVVTGGTVCDSAFEGCTSLTKVVLPEEATSIGSKAFYQCSGLKDITIPDGVTSIGDNAFAGCTKLNSIALPEGITQIPAGAFSGCTGLSYVTIPDSVTQIGYRAFYNCTELNYTTSGQGMYLGNSDNPYLVLADTVATDITSFTVPGETKIILNSAFSDCAKLKSVVMHDGIRDIGSYAFSNCTSLTSVILPSGLTQLQDYLFYKCSGLTSVTIPEGVTSIGKSVFYQCTKLPAVALPDNLLTIGNSAFSGCTNLGSIDFPDGLTEIGSNAFYGCTKFTNVVIPDSVQRIGSGAFGSCTALQSITVPFVGESRKVAANTYQYPFGYIFSTSSYTGGTAAAQQYYLSGTTSYVDRTYYIPTTLKSVTVTGGEILRGAFRNCKTLTSITLPEGISSVGEQAFYGCTSLPGITLPQTVTQIGSSAFSGCTSLQSMTIPQSVTVLPDHLFYNCTNLTSVTLPDGLQSIGEYAFYKCSRLTTLAIPNTVTEIKQYAFQDCTGLTEMVIPEGVTQIGNYAFYGCTGLTKLVLPNSVTKIGTNVLRGCGKLQELTIPFVGDSRKTSADKNQYPLGYLFGSYSYTGGVSTKQYYYGSSTTSTTYSTYYIPSTLKTVRVNGGHLLYGAFYNCANIRTIILGEDVTVVVPDAFTGTNSLEAFEVDINNPNYCSHNRILYNKDKTEVIWNPSKHTFILTVNYVYADGTIAGETIVKRLKSGVAYSEQIPDILGYSTLMTDVSGTMPFQDLTIDVVYYENPVVARGQCTDTLNWTMYEDGKLVLRGTGAMPDYESGTAPWAAYASSVKEMYLDPRITSIGTHAFENCSNMTYVDYGRSVDTIGAYAFEGCSALTSFSLPASVTQVAQGAFSGCSGLKAVVIPDNITAIGDDAFLGCTNLVQVTIGGHVTEIGSNAFAGCPNLTQIYFRGAPAAVGSNVFGETAGKFVFYYSTVSGWEEQIDGDSKWHGYAAFPYNALTSENPDLDSLYIIKVVDKHNTPLANAVVHLGDQTGKTNDKGLAHFDHKPTQAESLKIECSNHRDFIDEEFSTTSTQLMDVIEMTDKPSYIQGIRLNNRSIATSVQVLDSAKSEQVKIAVSGYSKYKVIKYELCQGSRVIATHVPQNPVNENVGYTFTVWANAFEEGQTVLVRMYTADGQSVACALNIDVVHLAVISETQIMDEFSNLSITIGLGGLGEYKVPFTVTGTEEEMVYVTVTGRTIRVGINLDLAEIFGGDEEDKDAPIGLIHKMVDNAMKNNLKDKTGVIFDLCGYIELEYLGNGEYFLKTTYVKVSVGVQIGFRAQASFYGIVGVYFEVGVSAKGTLELKIARVTPEEGFELEELNFSPEVGVRLEGGAYILWGAGSAGIYGELTMGFTLGIIPEFDIKTVYITGELGVTWSLGWGIYSDSYVIASGDIYRWPEGYSKKEFETLLRQLQTDSNSYTVNDRAYLEERSDWQGSGEYLQTGIYGQVAPKTITCGSTTMMLWLDDNAQRDLSNFQTLYYSIYTDGAWSNPVAVDDNGTFDCEFDVCTDGQKIYVIYTERSSAASGLETLAASDLEGLMAFANGVEVMVSVYENGSFGKPKALTNNEICETVPIISISGGKLTAAWLESNNVGADAAGAGNTLRTVCLEDGAWGKPTTTVSGSNAVGSMTVVTLQDQSCTAYTVDADSSAMTKDDQVLLLKDAQGEVHHLDTGSISRVDAAVVDGSTVLTWNKDGVVYMLSHADAVAVQLTPQGVAVSEHQLLAVDGQTLLLYVNNDRVYGLYLDETGPLTQGVVMVSSQGSISGFSATGRQGMVHAVFTETFAEITDGTVHTKSHLRNVVLEFRADIALQNLEYQILDVRPLTELTVSADVTNTGSEAVDSLTMELIDPQGKLVYTTQFAVELTSGSTQNCQFALVMPQSIAAGEYTLHILPCRGMTQLTDANASDNSVKLTLAYADLDIQAEQKIIGEKNYIAMTVENQGNTATHAVVEVYAPDRSGRQIAELNTAEQLDLKPIAPGQSVQFFIDIHALTTQADSLVTCVVTAQFADPVNLNNTDTVKLLHLQSDGFVADPDKAVANPELAVNYGTFDKYVPQDILVQINACKEEFSGIEGLIRGTDYTINYKTGVVTLMQSYLSTLETGNYTLVFQFAYDNAASATRAYNLTVTDSTPIMLSGSIAISGEPVVGSTLSADLSGLSYTDANVRYLWTVDGVTVSTERTYTIVPSDNEKTLVLTVTGYDGYAGSFTQEAQITLAQVSAPVAPVAGKVEATAITVVGMNGAEYSLDGKTWQASPVFTDLQPNTTYTIYARYAQTDSSFASDASTTTVTTPKHARKMGEPTRIEAVGAVVHFGDAVPTAGIGEGQISYGYSLTNDPTTVTVWSAEGILPQVDTPTTYYVFARITGSNAYEDAVSLGSAVQAHVHQYKETVVKPTTSAGGYTEHSCVCGDSYKDNFVDKLTYIVGDVNRDGRVNTQDRILLARYLAKWIGYDAERIDLAAADVNGDGRVNTQDRIILARYLAKWIGYEELPANR